MVLQIRGGHLGMRDVTGTCTHSQNAVLFLQDMGISRAATVHANHCQNNWPLIIVSSTNGESKTRLFIRSQIPCPICYFLPSLCLCNGKPRSVPAVLADFTTLLVCAAFSGYFKMTTTIIGDTLRFLQTAVAPHTVPDWAVGG